MNCGEGPFNVGTTFGEVEEETIFLGGIRTSVLAGVLFSLIWC